MQIQRIRKFVNTPYSLTTQTQAVLFTLNIKTCDLLLESIKIKTRTYNYYYHFKYDSIEQLNDLIGRLDSINMNYYLVADITDVEVAHEAILLVKVTPQYAQYINRGISANIKKMIIPIR